MPDEDFKGLVPALVKVAVKAATPIVRKQIENGVKALVEKANASESPYDEIVAEFAADLLKVEY
jgi:hypothetical protein